MSQFERFLKKNKVRRENTCYAASRSLVDEDGRPLMWTIRPISTKENEQIRDECMTEVPVEGKPWAVRPKLDVRRYMAKLLAASVVEPNLYDKELQDSYGVMTPEALVLEMLDNPAEYQEFAAFVQRFNGFDSTFEDKVDEAKK
ncbi:MAG: hypothetical protein K2N56_02105 [Oscillospiraceae bacterium]|nr:hypothetical protein [Oscillospiraceae bacterium]